MDYQELKQLENDLWEAADQLRANSKLFLLAVRAGEAAIGHEQQDLVRPSARGILCEVML